ncbi:hypothetical protein Q5P01_009021 [Channa striata]|uniref:Uncharacterized protein n=1 Tax=Channa striata TaxID=64152 RepID=A0AA88N0J9_CHASR|nr:hypothetical protein Q5P01_009021 [Channa striata]
MEGTEPTTRITTNGNQEADHMVLMSSKPLHRFVQREPGSLGIVIVMFGCAEVLMGFQLVGEKATTSNGLYVPFWQGALFLLCGNLSIYTERHPSKKMVTVCLAMYLVSFFGILVSGGYRIACILNYRYLGRWMDQWNFYRRDQLYGVEGLLLASSLCVSVLLIVLCVFARLALKSTRTQFIVQCIPAPAPAPAQSDKTPN